MSSNNRSHRQDSEELLSRLLGSGIITRREFNRRLVALGATATTAGGLLVSAGSVAQDTPKRGGRMRAAHSQHGPDDTLDPAKFKSSIDFCRGAQLYNGLTRITSKLEAAPELAESWEPNADASEWIIKLRRGVEFSNGKTLEPRDVIYSIMRHLDENVVSRAQRFISNLESIEAEDDTTLRFKLSSPNADLPIVLGLFYMKIVPDGFTDFDNPVGTGPFLLEDFNPGVRSLTVRNPNYWEEGRPYLDEIEWFGITDGVARLNALLAGDIHMMSDLDPKSIPRVEEASGVRVASTKSGAFMNFVTMCDREPFSSNDMRMAIKYLQDREKTVSSIFKGYATIGNDQPVSPLDPFYCNDIPQREFDPDRARFHLKKAGMEGARLELQASEAPGPGSVEMALLMQVNAARAGLNIDVKRVPTDGYWDNTWMQTPFHMSGWNMRPTADILLTQTFLSTSDSNESQWKNARVDELLGLARAETDFAKRREYYCEVQRHIHDDAGVAVSVFIDYIDAMSEKVKGIEHVPLGPLGASQWPGTAWLEA